jgi:hypothetical protein
LRLRDDSLAIEMSMWPRRSRGGFAIWCGDAQTTHAATPFVRRRGPEKAPPVSARIAQIPQPNAAAGR